MEIDSSIWIALSGWLAWLSKEIIVTLLGHQLARTGRRGVIPERAGVVCDTDTREQGVVTVDYFPEMGSYPQYVGCRRFRCQVVCQVSNDTETNIVMTGIKVELWGVEGRRLIYSSPRVELFNSSQQWIESQSISVPAHGIVRMRMEMFIGATLAEAEAEIRDLYNGAVALMTYKTIDDKAGDLRICRRSICGPEQVEWPDECKYPVYNLVSLNDGGRRAGRRPQARKTVTIPAAGHPACES